MKSAPPSTSARLFEVDIDHRVPVDLTEAGVVHIGGQGQRLVRGPHRARHETGAAILGLILIGDPAGELRAGHIDLAHQMLGTVIGLRDAVGREGVCFGNIGPGLEIGAVDRFRHLGLGQRENVVVALLVVGKAQRSGVIRFAQLEVLDLRTESAVGDQQTLRCLFKESLAGGRWRDGHATVSESFGRRPSRWLMA
jgi:hypothetical protein